MNMLLLLMMAAGVIHGRDHQDQENTWHDIEKKSFASFRFRPKGKVQISRKKINFASKLLRVRR